MLVTDIKYYLSGGINNSDPNLSLGGQISNTEAGQAPHNLFDYISPEEAADGDVEYRCIYVKNTNVSETLYGAVLYVSSETTSVSTTVHLAYDDVGIQSIVNESTEPNSPYLSFTKPLTKADGIVLGDIEPAGTKMIWLRWTVTAGAVKSPSDAGQFIVVGGTAL